MNEIIKGTGFHHIALRVNDIDKSIEFYQALGFSCKCSWGDGDGQITMMDMGDGTIIELFAGGSNEPAEGRYFHLAIKADDIDLAYNTAIKAGASCKTEPTVVDIPDAKPEPLKLNIAFVYGPSGEILEFFKTI